MFAMSPTFVLFWSDIVSQESWYYKRRQTVAPLKDNVNYIEITQMTIG